MIALLMRLPTISPRDLHHRMQTETIVPIDVNARMSWLAARVPGARHLDPATFEERDLPPDRAAPLVFYCSNPLCRKAPNAARRALRMGYNNVRVMSAGISGWQRASLPVESGEPAPTT